MIADLDTCSGELPEYDLAIVGSGPAGMTVAVELAGKGLRVCVLESGLARPTRHGDRLREVRSTGIRVKDYSRERVFGGASTTWAGLSSPLDALDFEQRPWLAGVPASESGWPIARAEMERCYDEAAARYRFPRVRDFACDPAALTGSEFGRLRRDGGLAPQWRDVQEKVFLAAAVAQDFAREHGAVCEREDTDLWLDATVLRFSTGGGERVAAARVRTRGGRELDVRARAFVLAAGGIENARLLLKSTDRTARGLGNEADRVGRFMMNHPKAYHGLIRLARPVESLPYYFGCLDRGFAGYAGLRLSERVQREQELVNAYVRFEPLFPWSDSQGVEAMVLLAKRSKGLFAAWKARHADELVELRDYAETGDDTDLSNERKSAAGWLALAWTILADLPRVTRYLWSRLVAQKRPAVRTIRLRNFMEMEPDPENRVTLSDERDVYDEPLALVTHDTSARDRRSLVVLHEALAAELERTGIGRLESDLATAAPWPIALDASHHMGTTRMGRDPRWSVVDPDLRLHTVLNLWVAGASVFPTSGSANPTYTIVALSIRLARHLERVLGARLGHQEPAA